MIQATRRCSIAVRISMSDGRGIRYECRGLSSSATTTFKEHTSAVPRPRAWSPPLSTSSATPFACGRHCSPWTSSLASKTISSFTERQPATIQIFRQMVELTMSQNLIVHNGPYRQLESQRGLFPRTLSTTKGKTTAGTIPGMIKGFGLQQKAPDTGNTALGKGFDLMEDDVGSRKKVIIEGYDPHGFQLGDGVDVRGSMICFPNSFVLWEPKRAKDITVESLHLLDLVKPKIDIIIVGVGERITERLDPALIKHLGSKRISVEQMDTVNACSTFNVLNAEDRRVAAALLQLSEIGEET